VSIPHSWKFIHKSGFDQVVIENGDDISNLKELNRKLWATLSCPIDGVYFDQKTLELIDEDKDGKIRISEILSAVDYLSDILVSLEVLVPSLHSFPLSAIRNTDKGNLILSACKQILAALNKPNATHLTLDEVLKAKELFLNTGFNGDGIITGSSITDENVKKVFNEIVSIIGAVADVSGEDGINDEIIIEFSKELGLLSTWYDEFTDFDNGMFGNSKIAMEALVVYDLLEPKIENYFVRDALIGYDHNAKIALNPELDFYREFINSDLSTLQGRLADLPIAIADGNGELAFGNTINPLFVKSMKMFVELWVVKLFGLSAAKLDKSSFEKIKIKAEGYRKLFDNKAAMRIGAIDEVRFAEIVESKAIEKLNSLIIQDKKYEAVAVSMNDVEKLIRLCANFYSLLNNFVVFRDFYASGQKAIFQAGTLFIDGRSCDLCVKVNNISTHAELAALSKTYLLYCDCYREAGAKKMQIAVAVTNGDSDNLMIGRNGVFYDRNGLDWDATIVKIIDFPISVRQAFWMPYKKVIGFIQAQVEKFAKAKEATPIALPQAPIKVDLVTNEVKKEAQVVTSTPPVQPTDVGKFAGIFAAIGLAIGAIGTAVASIFSGFLALKFWQMPLVVLGIILAISLPSMLLAWLKLRQRNLGPLLDACGWAINTRAKINVPFGSTLTQLAELPKGSSRNSIDPFKEKNHRLEVAVIALLLLFAGLFYIFKF